MVYRSEISGAQQMFCALLLSHTSSSSDTRSEAETTQIKSVMGGHGGD